MGEWQIQNGQLVYVREFDYLVTGEGTGGIEAARKAYADHAATSAYIASCNGLPRCHHCGHSAGIRYEAEKFVQCESAHCGATGPRRATVKEAWEAWETIRGGRAE